MSGHLGTMADRARSFLREASGSLTVEFIAVLPMILGVLALSYELGRGLWAQQIVTKDLRDAARYIARQTSAIPTGTTLSNARNLACTGTLDGSGTTHFPWTSCSTQLTVNTAQTFSSANFRVSGTVLQLRADVPLTLSFLNFINVYSKSTGSAPVSVTLTAEDQIRLIGD